MAKSNPVDETRIADPVERTKRQRHSNAKKVAGTAKAQKQQRRRKSAVGTRSGAKPATGKQTKQQTCLDLLSRREGATIEELQEATGWQKHSVRGFLAGAVRKKLGLTLVSEKPDAGPRRYRSQPPRLSRDLLIRAIAYRIQEIRYGGLSKATRRKLAALVNAPPGKIAPQTVQKISPGARLVREWNGRTHPVTVKEEGFTYAGRSYRSLTAIACEITGAHWSGPRFFGLARRPIGQRLAPSSAGGGPERGVSDA